MIFLLHIMTGNKQASERYDWRSPASLYEIFVTHDIPLIIPDCKLRLYGQRRVSDI